MTYKTDRSIIEEMGKLNLLADKYPNIQSASTELINLQAILNLPKGTEHFISDLHGEYETFKHILNNASGAIRQKIDYLYSDILCDADRAELSTLIYYPKKKLNIISEKGVNTEDWYRITLNRLIGVCKFVSSKYTRSKVRKALPNDFAYIIDELLHNEYNDENKANYYKDIINTIIEIDRADAFIIALCDTIKRLIVDHLHVVGDIFDRGQRADRIMDSITKHHSIDLQWGNHDIVWMGAAAGSEACICVVLNNSITYNNLKILEEGYGINLRNLALFATEVYKDCDVTCFLPKGLCKDEDPKSKANILSARMHKAVAVLTFKLESQVIMRNPNFDMKDRLLLDKIDYEKKTVKINNRNYPMKDVDFPTVDPKDPFKLSDEEVALVNQLKSAFRHSEKLQRHVRFLFENGNIYKCYNSNLLFHGCIPMNENGSLKEFLTSDGQRLSGKEFLDYAEVIARNGYYSKSQSEERHHGEDFLWFLWCGKNSPLFAKDKMATFERLLVDAPETWIETKNKYYEYSKNEDICKSILKSFGLNENFSHIINGHMPVRYKDGEKAIRANGRLIIIDGGFCKAYQSTTGIAGYTLIYNSYGLMLCAHEPFEGTKKALENNTDITSTPVVTDRVKNRILVKETDNGKRIAQMIEDLKMLLSAYRRGLIKERHKKK